MVLRILIPAFFAATFIVVSAWAQDNSNRDLLPEQQEPAPEQQSADQVPSQPAKPAFKLAKDLDGLYLQLKRTRDREIAKRIVGQIWETWQTSDSRSVDLLTHWARDATSRKRFHVALDLLDQVVTLRPEYAEGWNQRATVHFLMKNYGSSIADIERTLALEPRHFGALAGLANIMRLLGDDKRALKAWYQALDIYPTMEEAQKAVVTLEEELSGRSL